MTKFLKKSYFVILPIIVTALALCLNIVRYGAVDDILMFNIANSYSFNSCSELLMFINVGIGWIVKLLYGVTDIINWFSILYLILFNISFITYLKILSKHEAHFAFAVIISGIQFYLLMRISFTVISFLLACAGVLWFIDYVDRLSKTNIKHIVYSSVLLILAFSMRNISTLYCILLIFIGVFIFAIIKKRNSIPAIALIIVICIVANTGVTALNRAYKRSANSDVFYYSFQQLRPEASDSGKINYKKHKEEFKKAGITKNDLNIFKQFIYGDKDVYSPKMLETVINTRDFNDKYNINPIKILKNVKNLESPVLNYIFYYAFFTVILFILYKRKRLELFTSSVFLAAAELFLFVRRRGVVRVTDPIAAVGLIILIYLIIDEKNVLSEFDKLKNFDKSKFKTAVTAFIIVITVALSGLCAKVYNDKFTDYSDAADFITYDNNHTYLAAPLSADKLYDNHLTILTSDYSFVPVYAVEGEWFIYSNYWYSLMNSLDLNDYYDNAINAILNENIVFVSRNKDLPDYLVKFYKQHYNLNVKYKKINEFRGGMKFYEFKSAD